MILLGIIFLIIRYVKPLKDLKNKYEQAEQELVEATRQKNQMETILLHMTDGLIAFNVDEEIIHINPAAKKLLKIENEKTFSEIFSKYEDINLEKIMYLDNWASSRKQITVDERTINLFFAAFKNENDRPAGIIVVIQDITEHVKLDTMRKSFIADVSHELKTPITSIMGYADTLLETSDVDEEFQKKFLGRISSEAERMAKLVTDLLTLSRFDSSQTRGEKQEFDLGELVKYTYDGLEIEMDKKNQQREFYVTAEVPPVYADKEGIQRVIINMAILFGFRLLLCET